MHYGLFLCRDSEDTAVAAPNIVDVAAVAAVDSTPVSYPPNTNVICGKVNDVWHVTQEQMGASNDVLIKDCSDSTIFMYAYAAVMCVCHVHPFFAHDAALVVPHDLNSPQALGFARLENVSNCTVILGPVSGACYLESCTGSTIAVCCHQVRCSPLVACALLG